MRAPGADHAALCRIGGYKPGSTVVLRYLHTDEYLSRQATVSCGHLRGHAGIVR